MIFRVGFVQLDSVNDPTALDLVLLPLNLVNSQVLRVATKDTIGCNKRDGYVFCYRLLDNGLLLVASSSSPDTKLHPLPPPFVYLTAQQLNLGEIEINSDQIYTSTEAASAVSHNDVRLCACLGQLRS